MKKVIYIFIIFCFFSFISQKNISASTNTKVHLIFNKISYNKGEEIKLTINLENFNNLNESKVVIKLNEDVLSPVLKNNKYGQLSSNSIYEEALLNEYVDNKYLRFHLIKKNLSSGYYSGYKNNIGEFYFQANKYISNIYDYFINGNFEELSSGLNIDLYDIYNNKINSDIVYSEKIKVEWKVEKYVVDVFSEVPNYLNDINILNREEGTYELLIQDNVETNEIGTKIINIALFDLTNADYTLISRPIEVIDRKSPIITGEANIYIDSNIIDTFDESSYFQITDNYDIELNTIIAYYNKDKDKINSKTDFIEYLHHNKEAWISIISTDQSNNKSDEFLINVSINDVSAPNISEISTFRIEDYKLSEFDFKDLISLNDDYDKCPNLVFNTYLGDHEVFDYLTLLAEGNEIRFVYFGIDNALNTTPKYTCNVKIIDTTIPTINIIEDLHLNDCDIMQYNFSNNITILDNIDKSPKLIINYFIEDIECNYEEWKIKLVKGYSGKFTYYGMDSSNNVTETFTSNVYVTDTTSPVIRINNIKDENKYLSLDKIDYDVIDNFEGNVEVYVTLNEIVYENTIVNTPGDYLFRVVAIDQAGNESVKIIEFKIIENNVISCGDDMECYVDNYLQVVVIVGLLMVLVIAIFTWKVIDIKRKKKI